jgi:hypothetical protein
MAYSNFKSLKKTLKTFNLSENDIIMFPVINSVQPSEWLVRTLEIAEIYPLTNKKSKSERIIAPILAESALPYSHLITLFSGEDLTIEGMSELSGECDFFSQSTPEKA